MRVLITKHFQERISKIKDRKQLAILLKKIKKIKEVGVRGMKRLLKAGNYILLEEKVHRPPYRLYAVLDTKRKILYIVDWVHKKKQEKVIEKISSLLYKDLLELLSK